MRSIPWKIEAGNPAAVFGCHISQSAAHAIDFYVQPSADSEIRRMPAATHRGDLSPLRSGRRLTMTSRPTTNMKAKNHKKCAATLLAACALVLQGATASGQTSVDKLGAATGWFSADTRSAAGTGLRGLVKTVPGYDGNGTVGYTAADDDAIGGLISFGDYYPGSSGGVMRLHATAENAGKADAKFFFAAPVAPAGPALAAIQASYRYYNDPQPTSRTPALNIAVLCSDNIVRSFAYVAEGQGGVGWKQPTLTATTTTTETGTGLFLYGGGAPGGTVSKSMTDWLADPVWGPLVAGGQILGHGFNLGSWQRQNYAGIDWLESSIIDNGARVDFIAYFPVRNLTQNTGHNTIQAAIDAAAPGDTIAVDRGTFAEALVINKALTLLGAHHGQAALAGGRFGGESVISTPATFAVTILADDVTLDGFEITGFGRDGVNVRTLNNPGGGFGAYRSNVTVANNLIRVSAASGQRNAILAGEFSGDPARSSENAAIDGLEIRGNHLEIVAGSGRAMVFGNHFNTIQFLNVTISGNTIIGSQYGLFASASPDKFTFQNALVSGNQFRDSGAGVNAANFHGSTIQDNLFANTGSYGALIGAIGCTISGNTFRGNGYYGLGLWGGEYLTSPSANTVIEGNQFEFNDLALAPTVTSAGGLALRPGAAGAGSTGVDAASITLRGNSFENKGFNPALPAYAIYQRSAATRLVVVNASGLPANDNTFDGIAVTPATPLADLFKVADQIVDGVDAPGLGGAVLQAGAGFVTPNSHSALYSTTSPSIQRGIASVDAGDTVHVAAGTFLEDVAVNKAGLVLRGAGPGLSVISGPIGGPGMTVQVAAANVTVEGFTITREGNNPDAMERPGPEQRRRRPHPDRPRRDGRQQRDHRQPHRHRHQQQQRPHHPQQRHRQQPHRHVAAQPDRQPDGGGKLDHRQLDGRHPVPRRQQRQQQPGAGRRQFAFSNNDLSGNWFGQVVDRQTGGSLPAPGANPKNFELNWFGTHSTTGQHRQQRRTRLRGADSGRLRRHRHAPGGQPDILGAASANIDFLPLLASGTDTECRNHSGAGDLRVPG
jgi:nitrous oxidase accessory protein NosD